MPGVIVRKYLPQDRDSVRRIAWDTAFMGRSASAFFDDDEFFKDLLTGYFTDYEPGSCFVAVSDNRVVGYLIGCRDSRRLDRISIRCIAPRLLWQVMSRPILFQRKNARFGWHMLVSLLRGELAAPDYSKPYPATLHINMADGFRHSGAGSQLMSAFLSYIKEQDIPGVRLATYSPAAGQFFAKHGFSLLFRKTRTYFRYILAQDIDVYIYAKKL